MNEKALLKAVGIAPGMRLDDYTMWVLAPDAGLKEIQKWHGGKDGELVLIATFRWKSKKAKLAAEKRTKKLFSRFMKK